MCALRSVNVTRYIQPLREGGSLPALAEADDGFKYVLKFCGTGHGVKTLIAELIGGELARVAGFRIPELVFAHLDKAFGMTEGDEEIQDLLKASQGLNLALHFLSGAITFDPAVLKVDGLLASKIVWLDHFIMNVDRTIRNTNMLVWNKELWLIDNGSALSFQYSSQSWQEKATSPFIFIKDHVFLPVADQLAAANEEMKKIITVNVLRDMVQQIPDEWLRWPDRDEEPQQLREIYLDILTKRLEYADTFTKEAIDARKALI
jgi:hypothetical protein